MKMITDSLEKVYTAMGGADDFDKSDIANGIEQISEVAGGGGSGTEIVFVDYDDDTGVLNITASELMALGEAKKLVMTYEQTKTGSIGHDIVRFYSHDQSGYSFETMYGTSYVASTDDEHPHGS